MALITADELLLGPEEFTILADEFMRSHLPGAPGRGDIAGFAQRVYQLGFGHGVDEGEKRGSRSMMRLLGKV